MTSDKRMSDAEIDATIATLRTGHCKENHGCNVLTICACAAMEAADEAITQLRADLAAARRVEDGEVAGVIATLRDGRPFAMVARTLAANVVERLSAAKEEAERNWAEHEKRGTLAQTDLNIAQNKLAQAERERDRARTDALEEAASYVGRVLDYGAESIMQGIRDLALKGTP